MDPRHEPPAAATNPTTTFSDLLTELQLENIRLQRLVSELLLKNQQLRNCS